MEAAKTPNLDDLARQSLCGLHQPVETAVTPGSGPAHLALFGYDPLEYEVGRGVLSVLGIGFDLKSGDVAARQKGVKAVHNFIDVRGSSVITYDPHIDSWDLHDYEWYTVNDKLVSTKTDWEIERNIKDELFWSPFVDADQVKVEVVNGVAELTGTVDTWSEREAAGENALEVGALILDNDLAVSYEPDYYRL